MSIERINEWKLERFVLGELTDEKMRAIRLRMEEDGALRKRIEQLKESNQETLQHYSSWEIASNIHRRIDDWITKTENPPQQRRRGVRLTYIPLAAGIVAVVFLFLFRPSHSPNIHSTAGLDPHGDRIKGKIGVDVRIPSLYIFQKNGKDITELKNGARARQSDLLQLAYTAGSSAYGMIFSIDGKGVVTLHFPDDPKQNTRLQQKRLFFLEKSYELDNAPEFERFFFVYSSSELDIEAVLKKARELAANPQQAKTSRLDLPHSQITFLISKENRMKSRI